MARSASESNCTPNSLDALSALAAAPSRRSVSVPYSAHHAAATMRSEMAASIASTAKTIDAAVKAFGTR
jgi:hypothetical protein